MVHKKIPAFPIKTDVHGIDRLVKGNKFRNGPTLAQAARVKRTNASALSSIAEADVTLATRLIERELRLPDCPEKEFTAYPAFRAYLSAFLSHDAKRMNKIHEHLFHPFSDEVINEFVKSISPNLPLLKNAVDAYDDAMRLDPQMKGIHQPARDKAAHFYSGVCILMSTILCDFLNKSRKDEAVALLQSALEQNPKSRALILGLALTSMKDKFNKADALRASDMFSRMAALPATAESELGGQASRWQYISGDLACLCGNLSLARQRYEQAFALGPDGASVQVGFALCEISENNLEAAKVRLEEVLKSSPTSASANIVLAKIARIEGRADDAIAYANKAVECAQIYEEFHEAHLLLGAWLFETNNEKYVHHLIEAYGYPRHDNLPRLGVSPEYIGSLAILGDRFEGTIVDASKSAFHQKDKVPSK